MQNDKATKGPGLILQKVHKQGILKNYVVMPNKTFSILKINFIVHLH